MNTNREQEKKFVLSVSSMAYLVARNEAADLLYAACKRAVPILETARENGAVSEMLAAMFALDDAGERYKAITTGKPRLES
jgi:hypothetical protein